MLSFFPTARARRVNFPRPDLFFKGGAALLFLALLLAGNAASVVPVSPLTPPHPTDRPLPPGPWTGSGVEVTAMRDGFTRHFDLGSGQFVAEVSLIPRFYQSANGEWQPIDPSFTPTDSGWVVEANSLTAEVYRETQAVTLRHSGQELTWRPVSILSDGEQLAQPHLAEEAAFWRTPAASAAANQITMNRYWANEGSSRPAAIENRFSSEPGRFTPQLIFHEIPALDGKSEWLTVQSELILDPSTRFFVTGEEMTLPFESEQPIDLYTTDGAYLLTLDPPQVFEVDNPEESAGGKYSLSSSENGVLLSISTPAAWWNRASLALPAAVDPTMHVLKNMIQREIIGYSSTYDDDGDPPFGDDPYHRNASVIDRICAGYGVSGVGSDQHKMRVHSAYIKYQLPSLPDGLQPTAAYLVGSPTHKTFPVAPQKEKSWVTLMLTKATADWTTLTDPLIAPWSYPAYDSGAGIPKLVNIPDATFGMFDFPVTSWDVTSFVQDWYTDYYDNFQYDNYHGFRLYPFFGDRNFFSYENGPLAGAEPTSRACFPSTASWETPPGPNDLQANGEGLILYVQYESPNLVANEFRTDQVPSAAPNGTYDFQYHEYDLPAIGNDWQLVAAQGMHSFGSSITDAKTPLTLVTEDGQDLVRVNLGNADDNSQGYSHKPNYVVINGQQNPAPNLKVRVEADDNPNNDHNAKRYNLQTVTAAPAPIMPLPGLTTVVEIDLFREIIAGQGFNFAADTTVELYIPYNTIGIPANRAGDYDLRLFSGAMPTPYAGRSEMGAPLTAGPDGYEIEVVINDDNAGSWLLVLNSNIGRTIVDMPVQVTTCQNDDDVVRYPLHGDCVELRKPSPSDLQNSNMTVTAGGLRIFNPAGFDGPCNSQCSTLEKTQNGTPVMPLLGQVGDDTHWVALKNGKFTLNQNSGEIATTPGARLVLADFSQPAIQSLPVIRGQFEIQFGQTELQTISSPSATYLLISDPMLNGGPQDGWSFTVDFTTDRFNGVGPFKPSVLPTEGETPTQFSFDADWSITAAGGSSLLGNVAFGSVNAVPIKVGSVNVTPPTTGYSIEHIAQHAYPSFPQAIPIFQQVRMAKATIFQADEMGAAKLPVQAVIFITPGKSIVEPNPLLEETANGSLKQMSVQCGTHCFDLRGDLDAMAAGGPIIVREYQMPDIVIEDSANTVMMNLPTGVEIYSADHPMTQAIQMDDLSFNYGAFGASVRTYEGPCPGPRNPLDPGGPPTDGPNTTVVIGTASMSMPNLDSDSADANGGPEISVGFTLCEGSLRELNFTFSTGSLTGIPVGSSGLFMHLIGGTISLTPQQPGQQSFTTVTLEVQFRGMTPYENASNIFVRGQVIIDSRGLFDVQLDAGIQVFANIGLAVEGHFWVAWSPLDLGFEVEACIPYDGKFPQSQWNSANNLCKGDELLYGMLRMHVWQGQGWQNQYHWLPDNDDLHTAARFEARITIKAGMIASAGPFVLPPGDIELIGIKLAFGEFCLNATCTQYEWGVMGALIILGYDVGLYYGFDSGISFILGSDDHILIDEFGQSADQPFTLNGIEQLDSTRRTTTVNVGSGVPSALFGLSMYDYANMKLSLKEPAPGNRVINIKSNDPDVTVTVATTHDPNGNAIGDFVSIAVQNPLPGEWEVEMEVDDLENGNAADFSFFYFANQGPPEVEFDPLPNTLIDQATLPISWSSDIRDDTDMWISLYYETMTEVYSDTVSTVGPIIERVPLEQVNTTSWDLSGIPTGEYKLFARLENAAAALTESCGADYAYSNDPSAPCNTMLAPGLVLTGDEILIKHEISILNTVPPAAPTIINAYPDGVSNVVVRWDPNSEADLAGYIVTCIQPGLQRRVRVSAKLAGISTLAESGQVNGLDSGVQASCSVQAYDTSGNVSGPSAAQTATPSGQIPNPPAQVPQITPVNNTLNGFTLSWGAVNQAAGYVVNILKITPSNGLPDLPAFDVQQTQAVSGGYPADVGSVTTHQVSGLEPGATYQVQVRAYDHDGRMGPIRELAVTVEPEGEDFRVFLPAVIR